MVNSSVSAGKPGDDAPRSVLFVCSMNAIRSPMASAITRTLFPHIIYSRSAGIQKGDNDPFVATVMTELDINISTHYPHTIDELDDGDFDLIITLTPQAQAHVAQLTNTDVNDVELWALPDPTLAAGSRTQRLDAYRAVRDTLVGLIKNRFQWRD